MTCIMCIFIHIYICNDIYNYIHIWYAMFDSWHLHLCLQHFYALALLDVRFPSSPCSVGWTSSAHWEPRNHMKIMWFEQKKTHFTKFSNFKMIKSHDFQITHSFRVPNFHRFSKPTPGINHQVPEPHRHSATCWLAACRLGNTHNK